MKTFSGNSAIVAGAGGGMGLCIANDLIVAGVSVCLTDIKPQPQSIAHGPGKYLYMQGDLSDEEFVKQMVASTIQEFGSVSYQVNTAGVLWFGQDHSMVTMDIETWDRVFEINLKSYMLLARHVIPNMQISGGGALVHFSSIDALHGDPKPQDAYAISKAAIIRLSKSIAAQYASDGIRSNTILPGITLSPMQARFENQPETLKEISQTIPLGRLGTLQDMSNACLFLLSDEASYITGTELIVDGGVNA